MSRSMVFPGSNPGTPTEGRPSPRGSHQTCQGNPSLGNQKSNTSRKQAKLRKYSTSYRAGTQALPGTTHHYARSSMRIPEIRRQRKTSNKHSNPVPYSYMPTQSRQGKQPLLRKSVPGDREVEGFAHAHRHVGDTYS